MEKLEAKPIVENEFWILRKGNIKVGQIKVIGNDIEILVNGNKVKDYNSIDELKASGLFEFIDMPMPDKEPTDCVHDYPTDCVAHNAVWNVEKSLPLYTQSPESKSWFAAGYYKLNINGNWVVQFCPKLITLQRNEYAGPFKKDPGLNTFSELFE